MSLGKIPKVISINELLSKLDDSDIKLSDLDDKDDVDDDITDPTYQPDVARHITLVYDDEDHDNDEVGPNTLLTLMQANDAMHGIVGSSSTSASLPSNDTEQSAASPDCSNSRTLPQLQPVAKTPQFGWLTPGTGRRAFHPGSINWLGNYTLGDPLRSPLKYFSAYFTDALLNLIANQTN